MAGGWPGCSEWTPGVAEPVADWVTDQRRAKAGAVVCLSGLRGCGCLARCSCPETSVAVRSAQRAQGATDSIIPAHQLFLLHCSTFSPATVTAVAALAGRCAYHARNPHEAAALARRAGGHGDQRLPAGGLAHTSRTPSPSSITSLPPHWIIRRSRDYLARAAGAHRPPQCIPPRRLAIPLCGTRIEECLLFESMPH